MVWLSWSVCVLLVLCAEASGLAHTSPCGHTHGYTHDHISRHSRLPLNMLAVELDSLPSLGPVLGSALAVAGVIAFHEACLTQGMLTSLPQLQLEYCPLVSTHLTPLSLYLSIFLSLVRKCRLRAHDGDAREQRRKTGEHWHRRLQARERGVQ